MLKRTSDIKVCSVRVSHAHSVLGDTLVLAFVRLEALLYLQRTYQHMHTYITCMGVARILSGGALLPQKS